MLDTLFRDPVFFIVFIILLLVSVAVHEFAHAFTADRLGDPTARALGRVSLNPLVHIDPIGLLFILFWGFGWGKPVPYDPFNLRNPARDSAVIAFAGPLSSFLLALTASFLLTLLGQGGLVGNVLTFMVLLNVTLGIFNLFPVYPLDGFQVVAGILPEDQRDEWLSLRRYGILILLILLLPIAGGRSPLLTIIGPVIRFITGLLLPGMPDGSL